MKTFILILAVFAGAVFGQPRNEPYKKSFPTKAGDKLELDITTGGTIELFGWEKSQVDIEARIESGSWEEYKIDADQSFGTIRIEAYYEGSRRHSRGGFYFKISVPVNYNLELQTMGGDVNITNVNGEIEGQTMGGELWLDQLKGKIDFTTMGGDISLHNSDLDGRLKTMGGDVIFNEVHGDIDGTTMGGDVIYRNVTTRQGKVVGDAVRIKTMGGDIEVDDAPGGADVHTMGGDITIRSAREYVYAKTMGGEIDIREIDGKVRATTMGGEIYVNMIGDGSVEGKEVSLSSMGGEIEITLPANMSGNFDITLAYTRNSSQDYSIQSDFPLKIEEEKEWDYSDGSPRKRITASGKSGSGKNKIKISTINGDIIIRKGK